MHAQSDGSARSFPRVVDVEDDLLIRILCVEVLEDEGFAVVGAANGHEAVLVLEAHNDILIVFTDINMPGLDGLELARRVHARWPHIQFIVTSGRVAPSLSEMPDRGTFLPKPYHLDTVVQLIRAIAASVDER